MQSELIWDNYDCLPLALYGFGRVDSLDTDSSKPKYTTLHINNESEMFCGYEAGMYVIVLDLAQIPIERI